MPLEYRPAVAPDAAECVALRGKTRENAVSARRLEELGVTVESWGNDIRAGHLPGHVCVGGGRIVGYCFGDRRSGEIVVLAVLPTHEGRGIGRALLSRMVQELHSAGFGLLHLGCSGNAAHRSYGFYRHLGWKFTGFHDERNDEILELTIQRGAMTVVDMAVDQVNGHEWEKHYPEGRARGSRRVQVSQGAGRTMTKSGSTPSTLYPCFFYDDATTAIEWLCRAFGFQQRLVVPGPNDTVMHSELSFGPAVIMVASARPESGWVSPRSLAGINSATSIFVENPDEHFAQAKAAGAEVVRELRDEEYGGRGYMVRDPEGNQWYFGSYRPGAHWVE